MVAADGETGRDRISKQFLCSIWKKPNERPKVGGVSIRSRNGTPSGKECVINGQMTDKGKQQMSTPPPPLPVHTTVRAFILLIARRHLQLFLPSSTRIELRYVNVISRRRIGNYLRLGFFFGLPAMKCHRILVLLWVRLPGVYRAPAGWASVMVSRLPRWGVAIYSSCPLCSWQALSPCPESGVRGWPVLGNAPLMGSSVYIISLMSRWLDSRPIHYYCSKIER